MSTVVDFHELVRALEEHPEWRQELRRLVLTDELLRLPELVRDLANEVQKLAETQKVMAEHLRETDEELKQLAQEVRLLAEAQRRTEERVDQLLAEVQRLVDAQKRTDERMEQLSAEVQRLAEAQRRTEQRVEELAEAQRRTEQRVEELAEAQRQLTHVQTRMERRLHRVEVRLDRLWGHDVERRYRERAAAYFGRLLSGVEVLDTQALARLLDQARKAGRINHEEREDILWADVVVRGEAPEGTQVAFLLEVSSVVAQEDVERAKRRAELCTKALGIPVYPAVAGEEVPEDVAKLCQVQGVWQLADGRAFPPSGPANA